MEEFFDRKNLPLSRIIKPSRYGFLVRISEDFSKFITESAVAKLSVSIQAFEVFASV